MKDTQKKKRYKLTDLAKQLVSENEDGEIILNFNSQGIPKYVVYTTQGFREFSEKEIERIAKTLRVHSRQAKNIFDVENRFGFTSPDHLINSCIDGETWPLDMNLVSKEKRERELDWSNNSVARVLNGAAVVTVTEGRRVGYSDGGNVFFACVEIDGFHLRSKHHECLCLALQAFLHDKSDMSLIEDDLIDLIDERVSDFLRGDFMIDKGVSE